MSFPTMGDAIGRMRSTRMDRFEVIEPDGAPLLKGRKRNSFMYARWWDATDASGAPVVSLRGGMVRMKEAGVSLPGACPCVSPPPAIGPQHSSSPKRRPTSAR